MDAKIPCPIFTLRGHNVGATALAYFNLTENTYLISGDEEGSIIIWDLSIFRRLISYPKLLKSRVQSLRVVTLTIEGTEHKLLVAQSRDHGIQLLDLNHNVPSQSSLVPKIVASFPTYDSLFSKGDSKSIDLSRAILAYPSCLENHLVTVRVLGADAQTLISGTARRNTNEKKQRNFSVFDIKIRENAQGQDYLLFVAYEDGYLCAYKFCVETTTTVTYLNSTGLKIDLIKTFDLKINDFIAAFDVRVEDNDSFTLVCGSPLKSFILLTDSLNLNSEPNLCEVALKKQGVSSICIGPDEGTVVIAGWDSTVRIYSLDQQKLLGTQNYHSKQVQDILFARRPHDLDDGDVSSKEHFLCCASMEGTISISVIY